ncbi:hypothetical protein PENSPDRAFT_753940 [Peniophora sp. CONT]|nr:hypothetical protein PENSPDRAFT_753940 [Peniophora sp. CONT]
MGDSEAWDGAQEASAVTSLITFTLGSVATATARYFYVKVVSHIDATDVKRDLDLVRDYLHDLELKPDLKAEVDAAREPGMLSVSELVARYTENKSRYSYYESRIPSQNLWTRYHATEVPKMREEVQTLLHDTRSTTGSPARMKEKEEAERRRETEIAEQEARRLGNEMLGESYELEILPLPVTTASTTRPRVLRRHFTVPNLPWLTGTGEPLPQTIM